MTTEADINHSPDVLVEITPGRAPLATLAGAVDAALASETPGLAVHVPLAESDPRHATLNALCTADARVEIMPPGQAPPQAEIVVAMPATARPGPRTVPAIASLIRADGLAGVTVPVPGRFGLGAGKLTATGSGSGSKRLKPADVALRSTTSRGDSGPPPQADLAAERAEHLRHRARSATMRARMDRNAHRLSRERLQVRHERARLRLAERRLGQSGTGSWLAWRSRSAARMAASLPGAANSVARRVRVFGRRARRFAVDRWRTRGSEPA